MCEFAQKMCGIAHSAQQTLLKDVKNESFFHTKRRLFNKKWRSCPKLFKKNLEKVDDVLLKTPSHILFCEGELFSRERAKATAFFYKCWKHPSKNQIYLTCSFPMAFPDFFIDFKKSEKSASGIADFFKCKYSA